MKRFRDTPGRYPGRSLTYLEFENRITSISFAASLAPWEPFVSFWVSPSSFLRGFALALEVPTALTARVQVSLSPLMAYTRGKGTRYESYNGKAAALPFEIY